jgi:hypothetical protein
MRILKKGFIAAVAVAAATTVLSGENARGGVITSWGFESLAVSSTAGTAPNATAGGSGASITSDASSTVAGTATELHASASTVYSTPAGNGSTKALSSNNWATGDYYQFSTSTTGSTDVQIEFDQVSSGTGPQNFKVQYSTDGGATFNDLTGGTYAIAPSTVFFSAATPLTTSPPRYLFDLGGAIDNLTTAVVRLVDTTSPSGSGGTDRVDNFTIGTNLPAPTAAPEPGSIALLGFGVAGMLIRRKRA